MQGRGRVIAASSQLGKFFWSPENMYTTSLGMAEILLMVLLATRVINDVKSESDQELMRSRG